MQIRKAERRKAKLRVGIFGPSGSGKTMSALKMARGMASSWDKVCIIDTEHGSGEMYSHLGEYNVLQIEKPFSPERYMEAIAAAVEAGMEVIIIDSITHEWTGEGGILDLSDQLSRDARNSYTVWAKLTPRHNRFIERILEAPCHVICCGRSKQDYTLNQVEKNGKTINVPEKVGMKAMTREGFDYEMTLAFDLTIKHYATSTKDRTGLFQDQPEFIIDEEAGKKLMEWGDSGQDVIYCEHCRKGGRMVLITPEEAEATKRETGMALCKQSKAAWDKSQTPPESPQDAPESSEAPKTDNVPSGTPETITDEKTAEISRPQAPKPKVQGSTVVGLLSEYRREISKCETKEQCEQVWDRISKDERIPTEPSKLSMFRGLVKDREKEIEHG